MPLPETRQPHRQHLAAEAVQHVGLDRTRHDDERDRAELLPLPLLLHQDPQQHRRRQHPGPGRHQHEEQGQLHQPNRTRRLLGSGDRLFCHHRNLFRASRQCNQRCFSLHKNC